MTLGNEAWLLSHKIRPFSHTVISYGAWFYVNTMVNPLQVSWNHPLDVKPSVPGVGPSGSAIQMPEPQPFVNGSDFHTLPQSVTPRAISQQPVLTNEDKTRSVTTSTKEVLKQARAALQSSSSKSGQRTGKSFHSQTCYDRKKWWLQRKERV